MKYKLIYSLLLVLFVGSVGLTIAQNRGVKDMKEQWSEVDRLIKKDLPASALKAVESILVEAEKQQNLPEIIKAKVFRMRLILEKSPDEIETLIRTFEQETNATKDPVQRAILHSMTAELYQMHYKEDLMNIDRRTDLLGHIPEDMNEWTRSIYLNNILKHVDKSLENVADLQAVPTEVYADIVKLGDDSRLLKPTLFELLAYRKIDILTALDRGEVLSFEPETTELSEPNDENTQIEYRIKDKISETYQLIIAKNTQHHPVAEYAQLMYLKFEKESNDEDYYTALVALAREFTSEEAMVELIAEKARYLNSHFNEDNSLDNSKKEAIELLEKGIERYADAKRVGILFNLKNQILEQNITLFYPNIIKPKTKLKLNLTSQNIETVQLKLYQVDASALDYVKFKANDDRYKKLYPKRKELFTKEINLDKSPTLHQVVSAVELGQFDYGIYEFKITYKTQTNEEEFAIGSFTVTDLASIRRQNNKNVEFFTLDRVVGEPYSGVEIAVYNRSWDGKKYKFTKKGEYATDKDGLSSFDYKESASNDLFILEKGADKFFVVDANYVNYYANTRKDTSEESPVIALFTDRSLYRPGQTVYFKGIVYKQMKQAVEADYRTTVTLRDVNYKEVQSKNVRTNEFGSFEGEFVLPDAGLNGAYTLETNNGSLSIWVEEYKRPTFEVKVDTPKDEIRFGEAFEIEGNAMAYAGFAMSDATVKYRVVRRQHPFWWWVSVPEKIVANGETTTDEKGKFVIDFLAEKDKSNTNKLFRINEQYYTYHIIADITNASGETQSGEAIISVGDKSLFITSNIFSKIEKEKDLKLEVTAQTLNGETVEAKIDFKLLSLDAAGQRHENIENLDSLSEIEVIQTGSFNTKEPPTLNLKSLKSGLYRLSFSTQDKRGNLVTHQKNFILYSFNDKKSPVDAYKWLLVDKTQLGIGEKAEIKFGSSAKDVHLLYELMKGGEILERRWIKLSDEIKTFKIKFENSFDEGVTAVFSFVKDEQLFVEQVVLSRKIETKRIYPSVSVFRDMLKPGEHAEWTIHIPKTDDAAQQAELLVSMYDASLDALRSHSWYFNPSYQKSVAYVPNWRLQGVSSASDYVSSKDNNIIVPSFRFDSLNWFDLSLWRRGDEMFITGSGARMYRMAESSSQMAMKSVKADENLAYSDSDELMVEVKNQDAAQEETKIDKEVHVRENFNETAFFYPQLHTNADGNVTFSFTAPESLTRWNMNMLAHTRDLYYGQEQMQAITQKELMVQMNLPRFVRKSDKLNLVTNVSNLTDEEQTVKLSVEIINPATDKLIQKLQSETDEIITSKGSKAFEWALDPLVNYDFVVVKVVAQGEAFSDGEQRYLPVLPDKVLVTETQTLIARPNQKRSFDFTSFIENVDNVQNDKFVVEYTSNPTWYAVQALPTVAQPTSENAIDYFIAYYVNSLAHHMVVSNPAIKPMIEQWKNTPNNREALLSNLEKNEELKLMLLDETPWVIDAENETEQKRSIALLLDKNRQTNTAEKYLKKTLELQLPSGGFAWFKGMRESRYITINIVANFARLQKLTKAPLSPEVNEAIEKALNYLDKEIARDLVELRKRNPNYHKQDVLGALQLYYLYVRSDYPEISVLKDAQPAVEFYTAQAEKYWTARPLYSKALIATLAHRNGKEQLVNDIMKSLREYALQSDEMGMYWAENKNGFVWSMRALSTQAALIETFAEIDDKTAELDELKIWLLKQKQTQNWESPIQTVDAVYALINYGNDWLQSQPDAKIFVANQELMPDTKESGTGYFKKSYPVESLTADMGKITVDASDNQTVSWGSAYWMYYQEPEKVNAHGKELTVSKKLFVERIVNSKKVILPIEQVELKRGDKVITRLVLTTDRNLEYVALKDLRAANFEPVEQNSGYQWRDGVGYYYTIKDASTQYFFDYLPKGTYVFEHASWVNNSGEFSSGITSVQCLYAPEFNAHSSGERLIVK